jgi:hypothetical protein
MMNGNNSKLGILANLAGIRIPRGIPKITVRDGDDMNQIIKDMEARGEISPAENLPPGQIRAIVHRIISPPNGKPNWEGVSREERERHLAAYERGVLDGATVRYFDGSHRGD